MNHYLVGTQGAIIMYDITNINSLNNIPKWIQTIRENKWLQARGEIPIILVGNKSDLSRDRIVSKEEGKLIKEKHGLSLFMEASLKTGEDVDAIFRELANLILSKYALTN
jgi:GTPase SAR1 family protein